MTDPQTLTFKGAGTLIIASISADMLVEDIFTDSPDLKMQRGKGQYMPFAILAGYLADQINFVHKKII